MSSRTQDIHSLAISEEDNLLALANDDLAAQPEFARASFRYPVNDFLAGIVQELDYLWSLEHIMPSVLP